MGTTKLLRTSAIALSLAYGCADPDATQDETIDVGPGGKADSVESAEEFFGPGTFYMFQIKGWDRNRMANDRLRDEVCTGDPGLEFATLTVAVANAASKSHCPDIEEADVIVRTDDFCMRTSGNLTNGTPKSSYKISFEDKDTRIAKMKKINLKSMWNDVSQMRESLAWTMFDAAALPAERHTYARLCMDPRGGDAPNVYRGLYSVIEQVDKRFLKQRFGDNDEGNLYKAQFGDLGPATLAFRGEAGSDYFEDPDFDERTYELKTNDDDDDDPAFQSFDDIAQLITIINGANLPGGNEKYNTDEYRASVASIFDVRGFLRWAALNMLMGAWDNYWRTPSNYHLYNAGHADAPEGFMDAPFFYWVPHDYDNSFGIDYFRNDWQTVDILDWEASTAGAVKKDSGETADLPLIRHLFKNEFFVAYYLDYMEFALDTMFNDDFVGRHIGTKGSGGAWDRVRQSAFLEADGPQHQPHTGRQFSNDQVFHNGFRHIELPKLAESNLGFGDQFSLGIIHHVRMRHDAARAQLRELRKQIPRGSSGVTFPEPPTPVPAVAP